MQFVPFPIKNSFAEAQVLLDSKKTIIALSLAPPRATSTSFFPAGQSPDSRKCLGLLILKSVSHTIGKLVFCIEECVWEICAEWIDERESSSTVKVKLLSRVQLFATPWTIQYSPWNSPGHKTTVGSHSPLQEIFPTQGSNPGLLHCRWILYQMSHQGRPRILEWVTYPFSSGSLTPVFSS